MKKYLFASVMVLLGSGLFAQKKADTVLSLTDDFVKAYQAAAIPWLGYDYREYLESIPSLEVINQRIAWIESFQTRLKAVEAATPSDQQNAALLQYYLNQHQRRFKLEKQFRSSANQEIPADGLFKMEHGREWYQLMSDVANGVRITPEEIFQYGKSEVANIQQEIKKIRAAAGFGADSAGFQNHLRNPGFLLTNRDTIVARYEQTEETVRAHLSKLFEQTTLDIPDIACMTWPDAGPYTPPARYLSADENAFGTAVFQFNFYGNRHNTRAMDWIFIHEAIPGHHFQRSVTHQYPLNPLSDLFFEGGIVEGWAAYVEYYGEEMGLYRDQYAWLGKWEWDLVRSARIVISAGIHYYGWTKEEALLYWKTNVPGQEDIAEREITRCINWPAQVLTYKIGAKTILELKDQWQKKDPAGFDIRQFHSWVLERGYLPLGILWEMSQHQ